LHSPDSANVMTREQSKNSTRRPRHGKQHQTTPTSHLNNDVYVMPSSTTAPAVSTFFMHRKNLGKHQRPKSAQPKQRTTDKSRPGSPTGKDEYHRRQMAIRFNDGPVNTTNQKIQAKRRIKMKSTKRSQSAGSRRKPTKSRFGQSGGSKRVVYTGSHDMRKLHKKFQKDVAYNTMPWNEQSPTAAAATAASRDRQDHVKNVTAHMRRQEGVAQTGELAPLFDQYLVSPGGQFYYRKQKSSGKKKKKTEDGYHEIDLHAAYLKM
jgi:hypothetical protein